MSENPAPSTQMRVKPLEWEKTVDGYRGTERREQWAAETPWGRFYIWHYQFPSDEEENGPKFTIGAAMTPYQTTDIAYASLEAAQAAAQADYEQRVLSALIASQIDCPACGGTGRMGPFFPGGVSTVCGNCQTPSPQTRAVGTKDPHQPE